MSDAPPDMVNDLIRETYKSKTTLPISTGRNMMQLRRSLFQAKRFVADAAMSGFMAQLSTVPFTVASERWDDVLASLRHSARLPFRSMFIQYDNHAFRRSLLRIDSTKYDAWGKKLAEVPMQDTSSQIAWLLEQDAADEHLVWMQVFVFDDDGGAAMALPLRYAYRTDDRGFDPRLGLDTRPAMMAHGLIGCTDRNIGVRYAMALDKFPQRHLVPCQMADGEPFQTHFVVAEFSGDVRYALTLLATLNQIPKIETVVRPQKSYLGGGQIRKYLDYTTLRLALPVKASGLHVAKRLIAAARRGWHEVRPHWRVNHPKLGGVYCAARSHHVWLEADERGHANCQLCDARRVWIVLPTGRGDPTLSIRTHRYALTHPKEIQS